MEKITLVYAGSRINGNIKRCAYVLKDDPHKNIYFKNRILGYESIGSMLTADVSNNGTQFSNPQPAGRYDENAELVTYWSGEDRLAKDYAAAISIAKMDHPDSIDGLIDQIKTAICNASRTERARLALYVYNKLIK